MGITELFPCASVPTTATKQSTWDENGDSFCLFLIDFSCNTYRHVYSIPPCQNCCAYRPDALPPPSCYGGLAMATPLVHPVSWDGWNERSHAHLGHAKECLKWNFAHLSNRWACISPSSLLFVIPDKNNTTLSEWIMVASCQMLCIGIHTESFWMAVMIHWQSHSKVVWSTQEVTLVLLSSHRSIER